MFIRIKSTLFIKVNVKASLVNSKSLYNTNGSITVGKLSPCLPFIWVEWFIQSQSQLYLLMLNLFQLNLHSTHRLNQTFRLSSQSEQQWKHWTFEKTQKFNPKIWISHRHSCLHFAGKFQPFTWLNRFSLNFVFKASWKIKPWLVCFNLIKKYWATLMAIMCFCTRKGLNKCLLMGKKHKSVWT